DRDGACSLGKIERRVAPPAGEIRHRQLTERLGERERSPEPLGARDHTALDLARALGEAEQPKRITEMDTRADDRIDPEMRPRLALCAGVASIGRKPSLGDRSRGLEIIAAPDHRLADGIVGEDAARAAELGPYSLEWSDRRMRARAVAARPEK